MYIRSCHFFNLLVYFNELLAIDTYDESFKGLGFVSELTEFSHAWVQYIFREEFEMDLVKYDH